MFLIFSFLRPSVILKKSQKFAPQFGSAVYPFFRQAIEMLEWIWMMSELRIVLYGTALGTLKFDGFFCIIQPPVFLSFYLSKRPVACSLTPTPFSELEEVLRPERKGFRRAISHSIHVQYVCLCMRVFGTFIDCVYSGERQKGRKKGRKKRSLPRALALVCVKSLSSF